MFELLDAVKAKTEDNMALNYTSFVVSLIIAVFVGFILKKMLQIGAAILGGVGGFFIGVAIYKLLLFFTNSNAVLLVIAIFSSLFMAFLSFRFYDKIVIFGTSFIGSYAFVRGISLFLGYFPSEIMIVGKMSNGENL